GHARPTRIVVLVIVGDERGICRLLAHPDPNEAVSFERPEMLDTKVVWRRRIPWDVRAQAVAIKPNAMVAALNIIAAHLARRERSKPVRAAVAQDADLAIVAAEYHHGLVADRARDRLAAGEFKPVSGDVPLIVQIIGAGHGALPDHFGCEYTPATRS